MDKPEETEPTAPPRRRGNLFSWFVLLLAIPMFYLASAGPVVYLLVRKYGEPWYVPKAVLTGFAVFYYPAEYVADHFPLYQRYADWFGTKGTEAWMANKKAKAESDK